jgi:hypothetical protein
MDTCVQHDSSDEHRWTSGGANARRCDKHVIWCDQHAYRVGVSRNMSLETNKAFRPTKCERRLTDAILF